MEKHLCDEGTATMADVVGVCWLHAILNLSLSFHFPFVLCTYILAFGVVIAWSTWNEWRREQNNKKTSYTHTLKSERNNNERKKNPKANGLVLRQNVTVSCNVYVLFSIHLSKFFVNFSKHCLSIYYTNGVLRVKLQLIFDLNFCHCTVAAVVVVVVDILLISRVVYVVYRLSCFVYFCECVV